MRITVWDWLLFDIALVDAQLEWPLEENVPTVLVKHEAPLAFSRQSHVEHVSTLHAPEEPLGHYPQVE